MPSDERTVRAERLRDPGYTPKVRDLPALLALFEDEDDDVARDAARAILRVDAQHLERVCDAVVAAARGSTRPARGRLTRLTGELARRSGAATTVKAWLLEAVRDADPKTRRGAARALGKLPPSADAESALLAAWDAATGDEDRRPLAEALGKIGSVTARRKLAEAPSKDPVIVRAGLVLERDAMREQPQEIATDVVFGDDTWVRFHVRRGLEAILEDELVQARAPRTVVPGIVEGRFSRSATLGDALAIRTALHVSLPLAPEPASTGLAEAVVRALTRADTLARVRSFTRGGGPVRFRVAFTSGGHQRAVAWKIAELVRAATDVLVNDPTSSTWEAVVHEQRDRVSVELVPRGFDDERFAYRRDVVPASSHPTVAAAIARVAPRREDDVVWDPFVGAGAELVERARLGTYARLVGTDLDEKAVAAARTNLGAAGVARASITQGDALHTSPAGVTSILSNPPMGRRVQRGGHLVLLERFVEHAGRILSPGGSLVWIVPEPRAVEEAAHRAGLLVERATTVDMGGFAAELMVMRKAERPSRR